jgi:hypothetical protein
MLTRRSLLATGAAFAASPAFSAVECSSPNPFGVKSCAVGLQNVPVVLQDCPQWCWAACAELAFKVQGYEIDQRQFVRKVYGNENTCLPAVGRQIAGAISGAWTDATGKTVTAFARPLMDLDVFPPIQHPNPLDIIRNELSNDRLVIAGTLGHAIAITAMEYFEDGFGQQQLQSITVRDPFPTSGNRYYMSPVQFYSGRLLMTIQFS